LKTILYFNGDILTMEEKIYTDAVLIKDEKIYKIGKKDELIKFCDKDTIFYDLNGKTLMPSFIDCHSHFLGYASSLLQVSLDDAKNFNDIEDKIKKFINKNNIEKGTWIVAKGYDNNFLEEKEHPNKYVLDKISLENPIVIQHKSSHMGVLNSKALEELNITKDTENEEGGFIRRIKGTLEPDGYLEENSFISSLKKIPMNSFESFKEAVIEANNLYASYGITTAQEGFIIKGMDKIINLIKDLKLLKIDLIGYIDVKDSEEIKESFKSSIKRYDNNFKVLGYKIFLDGSPQGRTAWMLEPYKDSKDGYKGYPIYKDYEVEKSIELAIHDNMQILAHCNGDAAINQYINQYKIVKEKYDNKNEIRPVIVHAQFLKENMIKDVKDLNMIPSFFVAHVYHWGDVHIENLGIERAENISLANSALKNNIKFTFHQDAPVIEPNMIETIWCAVNRITKNNKILGENQKINVLDALKAITINGAYQYFEEDKKGSIKEDKLADLVVLNSNPLKVEKEKIRDIEVLETIKSGKTIFKKEFY
jgi:predicted amidohydrolase YtcJ